LCASVAFFGGGCSPPMQRSSSITKIPYVKRVKFVYSTIDKNNPPKRVFSGDLNNGQPLQLQRAELFCTAQIRQQAPNGFGQPEIRIE
jgi:hypothetical protein